MKKCNKPSFSTEIYFQVENILYEKDVLADIKVKIKCKEKVIKIMLNNNKYLSICYKKYGKKKILDEDRNKKWIKLLKKSINKQLKKSSFKNVYIAELNDNVKLSDLKKRSLLEEAERISANTIVFYATDKNLDAFIRLNASKLNIEQSEFIAVPANERDRINKINENINELVNESRSIKSRSRALKKSYLTRIGDSNTNNNNVYPSNLYVFVLDTGIFKHRDLNIDEKLSMNFTDSEIGWSDRDGHGTHVAGIIGAKNSRFALAPGVKLIAHKVLGDDGLGSTENIFRSLNEIKNFKQKNPSSNVVVNMSLGENLSREEVISSSYINGIPTKPPKFVSCEKLIQELIKMGVTFIVAAGNDTADASVTTPARVPEAITVGAYVFNEVDNPKEPNNNIADLSNFGSSISIMAPGVEIYSTWHGYVDEDTINNTLYTSLSGTSMATPIVTGAVVNMINVEYRRDPSKILTPSEIKQRLQDDSKNSSLNGNTQNEKISMINNSKSLCWENPPPSNYNETDCNNFWFTPKNLEKTYPHSLYIGSYNNENGVPISNYQLNN
jgi:subtilisin family serine protease